MTIPPHYHAFRGLLTLAVVVSFGALIYIIVQPGVMTQLLSAVGQWLERLV